MKPFTNQSRSSTLKEIKQIKQITRMLEQKKKQLNEERKRFQRTQRDREHKQDIHEYEIFDLIGDQQILLEQATQAAAKCHSLLNGIVYDLKVSTEMISEGMWDQNALAQIRKRRRPVQNDQKQGNKQRPRNLQKRIKKDKNDEDSKNLEQIPNQQVYVQKPESQQSDRPFQIQPMEKEGQSIAEKNSLEENKGTVQQFVEVDLADKNEPIIEQDIPQKPNQQELRQRINAPQLAPAQAISPIIQQYERILIANIKHQPQDQNRNSQNQNIPHQLQNNPANDNNQNQQESKIQNQSQNRENQIKDEQDLYQEYPSDYPNHPKGYLNSFPNHNLQYGIIQPNDIYSVFDEIRLTVPSKAHFLSHHRVPFNREEFFKYDYRNVIGFGLVKSNFTNQDFEMLSENVHLYPHLKIMRLSYNPQLTTVTAQMLSRFEKLQYIHFGVESHNCSLSIQSIQELKNYKISHPHVLIKCLDGMDKEIN